MPASKHNIEAFELGNENSFSNRRKQTNTGDVFLDVNLLDEENKQIGGNRLNIKALVLSCVQAALSIVKDRNNDSSRETDRVTLILKLLDGTEGRKKLMMN